MDALVVALTGWMAANPGVTLLGFGILALAFVGFLFAVFGKWAEFKELLTKLYEHRDVVAVAVSGLEDIQKRAEVLFESAGNVAKGSSITSSDVLNIVKADPITAELQVDKVELAAAVLRSGTAKRLVKKAGKFLKKVL